MVASVCDRREVCWFWIVSQVLPFGVLRVIRLIEMLSPENRLFNQIVRTGSASGDPHPHRVLP